MSIAVDLGIFAIDTLVGVKCLSAQASSNNYDGFEKPVGTKYQVPLGKVFRIGMLQFAGSTVNAKMTIGYGDTPVTDSSTPPTNAVLLLPSLPVPVSKEINTLKILLNIPSEKYPFIMATGGLMSVIVCGLEE